MGILYLINREYVPATVDYAPAPAVGAMLIAGAILIISGFLIIQRIVRIEV